MGHYILTQNFLLRYSVPARNNFPIDEKLADTRHILGDESYDALARKREMPEGGKGHKYYEDDSSLPEKDPTRDTITEQNRTCYDAARASA